MEVNGIYDISTGTMIYLQHFIDSPTATEEFKTWLRRMRYENLCLYPNGAIEATIVGSDNAGKAYHECMAPEDLSPSCYRD